LIQVKIKANEDSLLIRKKGGQQVGISGPWLWATEAILLRTEAVSNIRQAEKSKLTLVWRDGRRFQKKTLAAFQKMVAGQNIQAIVVPVTESSGAGGAGPR